MKMESAFFCCFFAGLTQKSMFDPCFFFLPSFFLSGETIGFIGNFLLLAPPSDHSTPLRTLASFFPFALTKSSNLWRDDPVRQRHMDRYWFFFNFFVLSRLPLLLLLLFFSRGSNYPFLTHPSTCGVLSTRCVGIYTSFNHFPSLCPFVEKEIHRVE